MDRPESLIDVAPTVLRLADLPAVSSYAGLDLAETCRRGVDPVVRPVFSESTNFGPDRYAARIERRKVIATLSESS
jgi:hypothetical protein